jgi:uncharacterized membrane protein
MNGNSKWIMWILGVLITISAAASGYAIARVDTVQNKMTDGYVMKSDYRADLGRIEASLQCLNEKMDRVLSRGR